MVIGVKAIKAAEGHSVTLELPNCISCPIYHATSDAGADSLANDRLGYFNLTVEGHAEAVRFMKKFSVPMLVTGGEGFLWKFKYLQNIVCLM